MNFEELFSVASSFRPWDMGRFVQLQFQHLNRAIPHDLRYWINFRKTFCQVKHMQKVSLKQMLTHVDLEFVGREHSGLDDARNLARIVLKMMKTGLDLRVNERMVRRDRLHLVSQKQKEVEDERARRREMNGLPKLPWSRDFGMFVETVGNRFNTLSRSDIFRCI